MHGRLILSRVISEGIQILAAGAWESRYNCCSSDLTVKGCCVADYHVTDTAPKSELLTFREVGSFLLLHINEV